MFEPPNILKQKLILGCACTSVSDSVKNQERKKKVLLISNRPRFYAMDVIETCQRSFDRVHRASSLVKELYPYKVL